MALFNRNDTSFSARFPLSPELWQEWIEDRRAAGGEDSSEDVLGLYGRAFSDYQCAKLWPGYLETLEESLDVSQAEGGRRGGVVVFCWLCYRVGGR